MQPAIAAPFTTSVTPHNNEFIPLASSVESSEIRQPMRRGPRTSSVFSRIQSLSRRRERHQPGLIRHQVNIRSARKHPHATQAAASPTYLSRHLSAFASRMQVLDQQIELIITASVGPVWSGQHLEHNAQRHEAPTHSTFYFVATIEGKIYDATFFTTNQHTHSGAFVPLASPVESSEIRSTCAARPSNIVHIFSHQTLEQTMITTPSTLADSMSGENP